MKKIMIIMGLLLFSVGHSQINNSRNPNMDPDVRRTNNHVPENGDSFRRGNRTFVFVPNSSGYNVNQSENGSIRTIGKLTKSVREDGFYIMYSNDRENPSYGRFDEQGNFRAYKYDPVQDRVIEDNYIKNMTDRNDRTGTNRNIRENMNSDGEIRTPTDRARDIETPIND